jgi:hypothetical protein
MIERFGDPAGFVGDPGRRGGGVGCAHWCDQLVLGWTKVPAVSVKEFRESR